MTHPHDERPDQSDLVAEGSIARPSPNPFAHAASISVSVPESVEIKLVDASALADYEIWMFIATILSSAFVGFGVSTIQAEDGSSGQTLPAVTGVFGLLFLVSVVMVFVKRRKLRTKMKRLRFRVGEPVDE